MLNIIIISVLLISTNVLLLDEEILILICFILFCWLAFNQLSISIEKDLQTQSLKIEKSITDSLVQVSKSIKELLRYKKNSLKFAANFELLNIYLFNFTKVLIQNLPNYTIYKFNLVFPKRLNFVQRLEHQVSKIVVLFIIKKLNQIILIKPFFNKKIKVTNFLCFYKINMREYIEII